MARGDARNFPVVREALGHEDALYGFKGGYDRAGADPRAQGRRLLAAQPRAPQPHQPPVDGLPLRPRHRPPDRDGRRQLPDRRPHRRRLRRLDQPPRPQGREGHRHDRRRPPVGLPAPRRPPPARRFEKVVGWNLHPEMLSRLAEVAQEAGLPFEAVSLDRLGAEADVIVTITSSFAPILMAAQVRARHPPRLHGHRHQRQAGGRPRPPRPRRRLHRRGAQSVTIGEAQHAVAAGLIAESAITELGAVINGTHPGRASAEEITLFDGTGVGLQDLAVAARVVELARAAGTAIEVESSRLHDPATAGSAGTIAARRAFPESQLAEFIMTQHPRHPGRTAASGTGGRSPSASFSCSSASCSAAAAPGSSSSAAPGTTCRRRSPSSSPGR